MGKQCEVEVFRISEDGWTWQLVTDKEAITPKHGETYKSEVGAKKAAIRSADRLNLSVSLITNLDEVPS